MRKIFSLWCILGIIAIFLGIIAYGLALRCWTIYSTYWICVPASIQSVNLVKQDEPVSGNFLKKREGSCRVECEYSYQFAGAIYQATTSQSGALELHKTRYDILKKHMDSSKPFFVHVNKMNPTEAVLFREVCYQMYWFMALGLACVIFGLVMCSCNLPDLKRIEPVVEEEET